MRTSPWSGLARGGSPCCTSCFLCGVGRVADWRPGPGLDAAQRGQPHALALDAADGLGGAPFFCVSASAPLLQAWFAECGGRWAKDPYFLYAASNLGSLAGLAAYPLLIEPRLTLPCSRIGGPPAMGCWWPSSDCARPRCGSPEGGWRRSRSRPPRRGRGCAPWKTMLRFPPASTHR